VLVNLFAYFALLLAQLASAAAADQLIGLLSFIPGVFLHGALWQPFTYSFIHPPSALIGTLFELLSLWFLAGFLEALHSSSWVTGLYASSVIGTAAAATAIYAAGPTLGYSIGDIPIYGCVGGIFGMLVAIGYLFGDVQFTLFPLPIAIKAKYLATIYALIAFASLFGSQSIYAFAELGGAAIGLLYVRLAPRRGIGLRLSEYWFGLRNRYYRWKRRKTARKFEVYMKKQGRTVRFDGNGRPIDDPNDKSRWN